MPDEKKENQLQSEPEKAPVEDVKKEEPAPEQPVVPDAPPKVRVGTPAQTVTSQFNLNNMSVEQMAANWPQVKKELASMSSAQY